MKYLFINSVAGFGSTGRIAAEKCRELMAQGHECVIAYARQKVNCDDIPTICIGAPLDYCLHGIKSRILDQHGFGSKAATLRFLQQVREYDPDVIWLHNVHGYYIHIGLLFDYLRSSGKKIYWTLHDCWAFTGHCSHFDYIGCDKWKAGCFDCSQKKEYPSSLFWDNSRDNYEKKRALFTKIPDLHIIVPSKWLANLVKESFLGEYPVEVVYNTIDREIFKPTESDLRQRYGLAGKTVILGVASIWNSRKGLDDFITLAQKLDDRFAIVLVGITEEQQRMLPDNILAIARTNNITEMAQFYTAADYFVNLTYEDNYPTVNLEAEACGTPVITYDTGGCSETLKRNDSRVVAQGDLDEIIRLLNQ